MEHAVPGDIADLIERLQGEESFQFEAKLGSGNVPNSFWETVSAFANTEGGIIALGLAEKEGGWIVEGVKDTGRMVQTIHDLMRNRQKISHDVAENHDVWVEEVRGKSLVVVRVRAALRQDRPVYLTGNRDVAFVRRGEGDHRCDTTELDRFRREASSESSDGQILPFMTWDDFDTETITRFRAMSRREVPDSSRHGLDDHRFLDSVGAWRRDRVRGEEGPTRAGILVFGTPDAIRDVRYPHVIDYRRAPSYGSNSREWTDRHRSDENLFRTWEEIFPRMTRDLPRPFRLQGVQRIDDPVGVVSVREALVNLLVHTDYRETGDAVIIHRDDGYELRNPGESRLLQDEMDGSGRSDRRNPVIADIFSQLGLAERAGSGFMRIFEEWRKLGYRNPLISSDPSRYEFKLELPLAQLISGFDRAWLRSLGGSWSVPEEIAMVFARYNGWVDNKTLRAATGQHVADASRVLQSLRRNEYLEMSGVGRNARYELGPAAMLGEGFGLTQPTLLSEMPVLDGRVVLGNSASSDPNSALSDENLVTKEPNSALSDENPALGALSPEQLDELRRRARPVSLMQRSPREKVETAILKICDGRWLDMTALSLLLNRNETLVRRTASRLIHDGKLEARYAKRNHPQQQYRTVIVICESDESVRAKKDQPQEN